MLLVEKVSNVLGDRKEEVVRTPFSEKKLSIKDVDEGTDELTHTPLLENKYSTKDVDKSNDELADMKSQWSQSVGRFLISFRVILKYLQDDLNLIVGFGGKFYNSFRIL